MLTYKFNKDRYLIKVKVYIYIQGDLERDTKSNNYIVIALIKLFRAVIALVATFNINID